MSTAPDCPICTMNDVLDAPDTYECAVCGHTWPKAGGEGDEEAAAVVKDANGNPLSDGDSVILVKDLKLKGGGTTLKVGAKAKGIRLVEGDHEIDCRVDGVSVMLKAAFVKKA